MYKLALQLRAEHHLGTGTLTWIEGLPENILGFTNSGIQVYTNYSEADFVLPEGVILLDSGSSSNGVLAPATAVWMRA